MRCREAVSRFLPVNCELFGSCCAGELLRFVEFGYGLGVMAETGLWVFELFSGFWLFCRFFR